MSLLLDLPEEIVYEILGNWLFPREIQGFDSALCNNSSTLRIHFLESISHSVFVVEAKQKVHYFDIIWASLRSVKLRHVELDSVPLNPPLALQNYTFCSQTESLTLTNCSKEFLSVSTLISLINSCPKLTKINFFQIESFDDECVKSINSGILIQLKHFRAANAEEYNTLNRAFVCTPLSNAGRVYLVVHCRSLIQLSGNAIFTPELNDNDNDNSDSEKLGCEIMHTVIKLNQNLTELQQLDYRILDVTFFSLLIVKALPNLQRLTIYNVSNPFFGLHIMTEVILACHNIEILTLSPSNLRSIDYICNRVSGKKIINLHYVRELQSNDTLLSLFVKITDFTEIRMVGCSEEIVDSNIMRIIAKNNPNLVSLKIEERCIDVDNITRDDFKCLVDNCPKLQKLHMYQYNFLSDDDLKYIFALRSDNKPHNFTYLNFAFHQTLDFNTLKMIVANCPQLSLLCFDMCAKIDDQKFRQYMLLNHSNVVFIYSYVLSEFEGNGDNLEDSSASSSDTDDDEDSEDDGDENNDI